MAACLPKGPQNLDLLKAQLTHSSMGETNETWHNWPLSPCSHLEFLSLISMLPNQGWENKIVWFLIAMNISIHYCYSIRGTWPRWSRHEKVYGDCRCQIFDMMKTNVPMSSHLLCLRLKFYTLLNFRNSCELQFYFRTGSDVLRTSLELPSL